MPQTQEAIQPRHGRPRCRSSSPSTRSTRKCASPDRVKQELSALELVAEDWGDTVMVQVSAIKGENVDKLLEMILLVTEVERPPGQPGSDGQGHRDRGSPRQGQGTSGHAVGAERHPEGRRRAGGGSGARQGARHGRRHRQAREGSRPLLCRRSPSASAEVPTAGDELEVYPDAGRPPAPVVGDRANEARATRPAQRDAPPAGCPWLRCRARPAKASSRSST
ncbi:hypothetical protein AAF143_09595 [Cyanobium sp. ATX-6F1]